MSSPSSIFDPQVSQVIADARRRANATDAELAAANEKRPHVSPEDWRDVVIYFLLADRFNNDRRSPQSTWDKKTDKRQMGSLKGVTTELPYLKEMGIGALWITPLVRNSASLDFMTYHGYGAQDFLAVDERWASDGTRATAESELKEMIEAAHDLGIRVILDIVLNHVATVFDYDRDGSWIREFKDQELLDRSQGGGDLPGVVWINGIGRPKWRDPLQLGEAAGPDDAIYPTEFRDGRMYRRRGCMTTDDLRTYPQLGYIPGDFSWMRQLTVEYTADDDLRRYGRYPVLTLLLRVYQYWVAKYDFDGTRIDTTKYVHPKFIQRFGTAMSEFAYSIGKKNFITFAEVWDSDQNIAAFIGRNKGANSDPDGGLGVDAALDFPVASAIKDMCTGLWDGRQPVSTLRDVYDNRRKCQDELVSSHGDASAFYITFVDNHDRHQRIRHPQSPDAEVRLCLSLLYTLPGIPCMYYGTEQDLSGATDGLNAFESVREALWGKFQPASGPFTPTAFPRTGSTYLMLKALAGLRAAHAPLRYGRYYFRQVSGNGFDFGWPMDKCGVFAFSRVHSDVEVLVVAYPNPAQGWKGWVDVDADLAATGRPWKIAFSSLARSGTCLVKFLSPTHAAVEVSLDSNELVVLVPS